MTMSSLLRSAARKARCFAESSTAAKIIGRGSQQRYYATKSRVLHQVGFATTSDIQERANVSRDVRTRPIPQPLPAVAYDWEEDFDDGNLDSGSNLSSNTASLSHKLKTTGNVTSAVGGRNPPSSSGPDKPYPSPSSTDRSAKTIGRTMGGGGGGGGRHRCPKCGTYTIFSHNEFGNSFYCATCSGWFTAAETMDPGDGHMIKVRKIVRCRNSFLA